MSGRSKTILQHFDSCSNQQRRYTATHKEAFLKCLSPARTVAHKNCARPLSISSIVSSSVLLKQQPAVAQNWLSVLPSLQFASFSTTAQRKRQKDSHQAVSHAQHSFGTSSVPFSERQSSSSSERSSTCFPITVQVELLTGKGKDSDKSEDGARDKKQGEKNGDVSKEHDPSEPEKSVPDKLSDDLSDGTSFEGDEDDSFDEDDEIDDLEDEEDEQELSSMGSMVDFLTQYSVFRPSEVVHELEKFIIGQEEAKKSVAVALRNRWRRLRFPEEFRKEIHPKNILMIGPTGCGKTEIARRLAKIAEAPFVKAEATKYTEVGFHGRDVDKIIHDLVENSINLVKKLRTERLKEKVQALVEERLALSLAGEKADLKTLNSIKELLRNHEFEENEVEIEVPIGNKGLEPDSAGANAQGAGALVGGVNVVPIQIEFIDKSSIKKLAQNMEEAMLSLATAEDPNASKKTVKKKMKVHEARTILINIEMSRFYSEKEVTRDAIFYAEEKGIVFIDEIDKICNNNKHRTSGDASDEGVQRDLLPLIEGSEIETRYGHVKTDHILFICSGSFYNCSPSDLLPELQGRLPVRVECSQLTEKDLYRIFTEPKYNLIRQQVDLISTEGIDLVFEEDAIRKMASMAAKANNTIENIGARRLHTIIEKVMENISFEAPDVVQKLQDFYEDIDEEEEEQSSGAKIIESHRSADKEPAKKVLGEADYLQQVRDSLCDSDSLKIELGEHQPKIIITKEYVDQKIGTMLEKINLDKFIL